MKLGPEPEGVKFAAGVMAALFITALALAAALLICAVGLWLL